MTSLRRPTKRDIQTARINEARFTETDCACTPLLRLLARFDGVVAFVQPRVLHREPSLAIIKAAWDLAINTIDTANVYSNGEFERLIAKFMKKVYLPVVTMQNSLSYFCPSALTNVTSRIIRSSLRQSASLWSPMM